MKNEKKNPKVKNTFIRVLGNSPTAKILDWLLEMREFDYAVSDIVKGSGVHRNTANIIISDMIDEDVVKKTRKMGKSQLYKINMDNVIINKIFELHQLTLDT